MKRAIQLLVIVPMVACGAALDVELERQALMEADRAFARATAQRGVEGWLAYHASDGRNVGETGEVAVGHEAIRRRMEGFLSDTQRSFTWDPVYAEVGPEGRMGYTHGEWTVTNLDSGALEARGRYLTVWVKQSDGTWKVVADIGNTEPAGG